MDLYATKQGSLIQVVNLKNTKNENKLDKIDRARLEKRTKRGKIKKFSKNSKRRLGCVLARVKRKQTYFITLTFKDNFQDGEKAKSYLDNLARAINKINSNIWFVWKFEYQKRGAIHFHLIVGGCGYRQAYYLFKKYWVHGFVDVKTANKLDYQYFSKYILKQPNISSSHTGRFWGIVNRTKFMLALDKLLMYTLTEELKQFFEIVFKNRGIDQINSKITIFT